MPETDVIVAWIGVYGSTAINVNGKGTDNIHQVLQAGKIL
jgi:hypothetical protein